MRWRPGVRPRPHACQAELDRHVGSEVLSELTSPGREPGLGKFQQPDFSNPEPSPRHPEGRCLRRGRSQSPAEIRPQSVPDPGGEGRGLPSARSGQSRLPNLQTVLETHSPCKIRPPPPGFMPPFSDGAGGQRCVGRPPHPAPILPEDRGCQGLGAWQGLG